MISDKLQREVFHFLFLERLLKISDPKLYILKGGVNFRFFFESPRYSEDMDLDVVGGSVETLKKNGYKILEDDSFLRSLKFYEIDRLILSDKSMAKQTETTQRFKLRLVNKAGEEFPTKIEFSRRESTTNEKYLLGTINPKIAAQFKKISFHCYHYHPESAVIQKILALAGRAETQARDVFDLYLLYLGGHFSKKNIMAELSKEKREKAILSMGNLDYDSYRGQVVEYLETESQERFSSKESWKEMLKVIEEYLDD